VIRARLPLEAGSGIEPLYEDLQSRRLRFSEHLEQLFCQEFQLRKRYLRIPNHPCRSRVFFAGLRRNYTGTGRAPVVDGVIYAPRDTVCKRLSVVLITGNHPVLRRRLARSAANR